MDEFQEVLDGKKTTEGWDAEKLVGYHKFLGETAQKTEAEVRGLREAKRSETERVEKLKKDADEREETARKAAEGNGNESPKPPENKEMTQFRKEQVEKAKLRLFSEVSMTDEEKAIVEGKFILLDSGKMDAEFIYKDFLSAVAAANPDKFMSLSKSQQDAQREADEETARQAGGGGDTAPAGNEPKKFTDAALALSKQAGITPEEATRQTTEGMTRVYDA